MRRLGATLRGFGSYHISTNSILKGGMSPPMITNSVSNGAVIVRHREYLTDIFPAADQSFKNLVRDINPGLQNCFPWLAQIAPAFQQYRFRGLVFEYKTTSADLSVTNTNPALGTVIMATQYNALDTQFTNKYEMENWEFSTSCKPSVSCLHPVECAKSQTPVSLLWVRTGAVPDTGDARLYDLGNFNLATVGVPGNGAGAIGELWVSYEIEFFKPQFREDVTTSFAHFSNRTAGGGELQIGNPQTTHPFGTLNGQPANTHFPPLAVTNSSLPCYLDPTNDRIVITDSIGKNLIVYMRYYWGAGITPITNFVYPVLTATPAPNGQLPRLNLNVVWASGGTALDTNNPTTSTSVAECIAFLAIRAETAYIDASFGGGTWTGNGTSGFDIWITELPSSPPPL